MSLEENLIELVRQLPPEKQQEVLDFADYLRHKTIVQIARSDPRGLWSDFGVHLTEADIAEARQEMWGRGPRDKI